MKHALNTCDDNNYSLFAQKMSLSHRDRQGLSNLLVSGWALPRLHSCFSSVPQAG